MGQDSEVMAREGGVTTPSTCLQNLADSVILLEKKTGQYHGFPEPKERGPVRFSPIASRPVISLSGARRGPCS